MKKKRILIEVEAVADQDVLITISRNDYRVVDPASVLEIKRAPQDVEMVLLAIEKAYGASGKQSAEVIRMRYGLGGKTPMALFEIARMWGLTREKVRQIEERAMLRLRRIAVKFGIAETFRMPSQRVLIPRWEVKK